jgi:hypothetical protein
MVIKQELALIVIPKDPNFSMALMDGVVNSIASLDDKKQESYFKRSKAMLKMADGIPPQEWWLNIGREVSIVSGIVNDAILSIYSNGGSKQYLDAVVFELAGYQIKNVKKICEHAVRTYSESKALPPVSYWLQCITTVKSSQPARVAPVEKQIDPLSDDDRAEMSKKISDLGKKLGWTNKKKGAFTNKATLVRYYGILQNLNKGLRQVKTLDDKDYEWVEEWEVGDRKVIDHSKTLDMFNSGRVSESEAREAYDKFNEGGRV